jgi:hypothetical protein
MCNVLFFGWQWLERESKSAEFVSEIPQSGTANELRLLSEVDPRELLPRAPAVGQSTQATASRLRSQSIKVSAAASSAARSCYSLGPIAKDEDVTQLRAWIVAAGGTAQIRLGERRELALYWVYLPPFSTRAEAVHFVQEMDRSGIKDIFVIPRGDMANAVSLGVYARNASLERRLRQLKAKGYDASVLPRYRVEAASWIDAEFSGSKGFAKERFDERFPDIEAIAIACETTLADEHSGP